MSIQTKITVNSSEYLSSKPSKIASVPEDNHAKRSLAQHTIRISWNKESTYRGKISKEYSQTCNEKAHYLEPQPIWVVEADRVEAAVAAVSAVDANPEAAADAEAITPLH